MGARADVLLTIANAIALGVVGLGVVVVTLGVGPETDVAVPSGLTRPGFVAASELSTGVAVGAVEGVGEVGITVGGGAGTGVVTAVAAAYGELTEGSAAGVSCATYALAGAG